VLAGITAVEDQVLALDLRVDDAFVEYKDLGSVAGYAVFSIACRIINNIKSDEVEWMAGWWVVGISGRGSQTAASRLLLMTTPMACDLFMIDSFVLTSAKRVIPLAEGGRKCLIFLKYCAQIFPP